MDKCSFFIEFVKVFPYVIYQRCQVYQINCSKTKSFLMSVAKNRQFAYIGFLILRISIWDNLIIIFRFRQDLIYRFIKIIDRYLSKNIGMLFLNFYLTSQSLNKKVLFTNRLWNQTWYRFRSHHWRYKIIYPWIKRVYILFDYFSLLRLN